MEESVVHWVIEWKDEPKVVRLIFDGENSTSIRDKFSGCHALVLL